MAIVPSTNKQELLSQLYMFRGILGALYCDYAETQKSIQNAEESENNYYSNKRYIPMIKESIRDTVILNKVNSKNKAIKWFLSILTITLFIGISATLCAIFYLYTRASVWPGLGIMLVVLLPIVIVLFILYRDFFKEASKIDENERYRIKYGEVNYVDIDGTTHFRDHIIVTDEELNKYILSHKSNDEVKELYSTKKSLPELEKAVAENKKAAEIRKDSFNSKRDYVARVFGNFLLQSDWRMIDTLIYMVASGRANTMQEALNYGDLKLRHEETMNMLNSVKATMEQGYMRISSGLNELTKTVNYLRGDVMEVSDGIYNLQKSVEFASLYLGSTMHIESKEIARTINEF